MADEETPKKTSGKTNATPPAAASDTCLVAKCKQPVRAKGYCRKHYLAWRRGDLGKKQRYNTCSKEGCRKPATAAGRCAEHKKGATEAAAS